MKGGGKLTPWGKRGLISYRLTPSTHTVAACPLQSVLAHTTVMSAWSIGSGSDCWQRILGLA